MTLENIATADAPAAGSETTTTADAGSELDTRFAGILDIDNAESVDADQPQAAEGETEGEGAEETAVDPWADYEDFEINGKTYKIPSEIKDGYMKDADYRRKTTAVAEQAKAIQAREAELNQKFQQTEEEFKTWRELDAVSEQLKQAEGIDWAAEYNKLMNDPRQTADYLEWDKSVKQFQAIYMQVQQLQQKQQGLINSARQFEQQRSVAAQQEAAKRIQETVAYAQKNIKGWTPELDVKITEFALKRGYTAEMLKNGINPLNYDMLHLAYLGHQSQIRQQTAKPAPTGKPPAATQTLSAKANPSVSLDPESMSMEDYVKARASGKIK